MATFLASPSARWADRARLDQPFADLAHLSYYSQPRRMVSAASYNAPAEESRGRRRARAVQRQAAEVSAAVSRLQAGQPLASYPLRLPASAWCSRDSSGSSSESESEPRRRRPAGGAAAVLERPPAPTPAPAACSATTVMVCQGKHCQKRGSATVLAALQQVVGGPAVAVAGCKCLKQCERGPAVRVQSAKANRTVVYTGAATSGAVTQLAQAVLHEF